MQKVRWLFSVGMAGLPILLGFLFAGPAIAAQAAPANCVGGVNGFTDIPDSLQGSPVNGCAATNDFAPWGAVYFSLRIGTVNGQKQGWGRLEANLQSLEVGKLWMDVSQNIGSSWIQCGSFFQGLGKVRSQLAKTSLTARLAFVRCGAVFLLGA